MSQKHLDDQYEAVQGRRWSPSSIESAIFPLEFSVQAQAFGFGFGAALNYFSPDISVVVKRINARLWFSIVTSEDPISGDEILTGNRRLMSIVNNLDEVWNGEVLPEMEALVSSWEQKDWLSLTSQQLAEEVQEVNRQYSRIMYLHHLILLPSRVALARWREAYHERYLETNPLSALELLQGTENHTINGVLALWRLALSMSADTELADQILGRQERELSTYLTETRFRAEFRDFLRLYGQEADGYGLYSPTWLDDPSPATNLIASFIRCHECDPSIRVANAQDRGNELHGKYLEGDLVEGDREGMDALLAAARAGLRICEDHGTLVHAKAPWQFRRLLQTIGGQLVSGGVIDYWTDIFFLFLEELVGLLKNQFPDDVRRLIELREREMRRFSKSMEQSEELTIPIGEAESESLLGSYLPLLYGSQESVTRPSAGISGVPASRGFAVGVARVVLSQRDNWRIQPGDILVCENGGPPWSFAFPLVRAVVADTGTVFGHCACLARSLNLPAVVSARNATKLIQDGDLIQVDGATGAILVLT